MAAKFEQPVVDFYAYPPVGGDDWRYVRETAVVRAYEMYMLTRGVLLDMANADSFEAAAGHLASTEYAMGGSLKTEGFGDGHRQASLGAATLINFAELEEVLLYRRQELRRLFEELILDKPIIELFKTRDDFANLRLAVRRTLTEKPIGTDYSKDGNVAPEQIEQIFSEQDEFSRPAFADYIRQAAERAVLAYYQNKDIRQVDYAIDNVQAEYNLKRARQLNSIFLAGLFRIQIDLTNIRTMCRLKFTESENRNVFLEGGFVEMERFLRGLELGYESLGQLFFVTPYYQVVESGAGYLASNNSFLALEQKCDEHLIGFLKTTIQITAGPQPIIAYLLMKENEIRIIRLILIAKKNHLDTQLILDRIS